MARLGIAFEAEQACRRYLHGFRQFHQGALRIVRPDVRAVNRTKSVILTGARCFPARFWITERDEMNVTYAFVGEAFGQLLLRKPGLSRDRDCTYVSQLPYTGRLQGPDEPINIGPFISNCE